MKKKVLIRLFISLVLIVLLVVGLKPMGIVTGGDEVISVTRLIEEQSVRLGIVSSENVLAVQEFFTSDDCEVASYELDKEIEVIEFKSSENTWILGTTEDNLEVELSYIIPFGCEVKGSEGRVFMLSGDEDLLGLGFEGEELEDGEEDEGEAGEEVGEDGEETGLISTTIEQAEDEEEFEEKVGKATQAIAKLSGQKGILGTVRKSTLIIIGVLILAVLGVVVFFIVSFVRKKQFQQTQLPQTGYK